MILKLMTLAAVAGVLTAATKAEQNDPRRVTAVATASGSSIKIVLTYQLTGGPDSVITRIGGAVTVSHRLLAVGAALARDSFLLPRPTPGTTVSGPAYVQAKRRGLVSIDVRAVPDWTYTEPDSAPPPPIVNPPVVDTTYFDDSFRHDGVCKKGPTLAGFGWGTPNTGSTNGVRDSIRVVDDARGDAGCALALIFQADTLGGDGWAEQRFTIGGKPTAVFVGFVLASPANYRHRTDNPSNNKLLRLWDLDYNSSQIHVGMSTMPRSDGRSQLIAEYNPPSGTGMGNYGTGPYTVAMYPSAVDTIGYYTKASSAVGATDGVIRIWWNRTLIYNKTNLALTKNPPLAGSYNAFGNGYLLGWANSGFAVRTEMRVLRFVLAPAPIAWFLPS